MKAKKSKKEKEKKEKNKKMDAASSATNSARQRLARLRMLWRDAGVDAAEKEVAQALRTTPKDPNLLHLGAEIAEHKKQNARAITLLGRAVEAYPHFVEAAYNLARLLGREGRDDEAIRVLQKAAEASPRASVLWQSLGHFYQKTKDLPAAIAALETYCALVPEDLVARGQYYLLCGQICDWRKRPSDEDGLPDLSPQAMIVFSDDPLRQRHAAEAYAKMKFAAVRPLPPLARAQDLGSASPSSSVSSSISASGARLKVGYLSADFHAHATAFLMAELFELHDKTRFEIFAYSYGVEDQSDIRARLRRGVEHFVVLNDLSVAACAQKIRADGIDILIDLKGYTQGSHLDILAYRPAPVQAHWLGYPGTLGTAFVDYLFADAETVPPENDIFFSEKIIRLPVTYQINDRHRGCVSCREIGGRGGTREDFGLPAQGFVFASFNQTLKITPDLFAVWMRLLRDVPDSVLWLFESNPFAPDFLRRAALAQGVTADRLLFAKPCALEQHLARYAHVDLALDCFPYGGHTTTSDALWCGVPVVTLRGKSFPSRVAASLLKAADLGELVSTDLGAYERLARELAQDRSRLNALKARLWATRDTVPLFDTPRFVRDWEKALADLWGEHKKGGG